MKGREPSLTTFEIQKRLGIKRNRLKGWIPKYVKPSIEKTSGPGTASRMSRFDLYRLLLFKYLIERGYKRKAAAERMRIFRHADLTRDPKKINLIALIHRTGGKYLDPNYKPQGKVKRAWGTAYPDVIYGANIKEIYDDLKRFDILKNESDDVLIINFKKIRDAVDFALM